MVALLGPVDAAAHGLVVRGRHAEPAQRTAAGFGELVGDLFQETTDEPVAARPVEIDAAVVTNEVARSIRESVMATPSRPAMWL
ncbi:MAG: hypothetical protein ACRDQU_15855 [Pseudonocardiaceae bacterium]